MTRYETAPTARGNIGVSYESQAIAGAQAETMDAFYCTRCTDCTRCTGCTRCELYYLGEPSKITRADAVANLDRVREIILDQPARLEMGHWHGDYGWQEKTCAEEATCGTTHCLAGWLQVCTTDPALRRAPPEVAGAVLAPVAAKMFYRGAPEVMTWLQGREYAKEPA